MSELRRIMMMFPRPEGSTPPVTVDGYVAFLSDFSDMISGSRIATDGSVETLSGWSISGYIEIPDDARYVYYDEDIDDQYTGLYDSSKTYIGHITKGNAVSLSAKYLRVSMPTDNISDEIIVILKEQREEPIVLPYDAEVEYLESNGTQYIDTGIIPDANTGIYLNVECSNNNDTYLVGLRDTTGNTRWCIGHATTGFYYGYGTNQNGDNRLVGTAAELWLDYKNDGRFVASNGVTTKTLTLPSLAFTPVNNIRLFGSSGISADYTKWPGKIYSVQITQENDILMDLIPVRKDGVGYMYDKVSGELLGNNGTGSFTYGNDVNE